MTVIASSHIFTFVWRSGTLASFYEFQFTYQKYFLLPGC